MVMSRLDRVLEKDARSWVRDNWTSGVFFTEHALGGTKGISDCHLLLPRRMTPCELKRGEIVKDGFTFELRKAQRDYHRECHQYGIGTIFLMTVEGLMKGTIGQKVVSHYGSWPFRMWVGIHTHGDVVCLVNESWKLASRPHLVQEDDPDG